MSDEKSLEVKLDIPDEVFAQLETLPDEAQHRLWKRVGAAITKAVTDFNDEERVVVQKPFASYENWEACVADQKSKGHSEESAKKICGKIKAQTESA